MAVLGAAVATVGAWFVLVRGGDGDGAAEHVAARGISEPVRQLVGELEVGDRVDQVLLLGFEGTDADGPIADELSHHHLGGVLFGPQNWLNREQGTRLVGALRATALRSQRVLPLIIAQQEGGPYRSLTDLEPAQSQLDVGFTASTTAAEAWAREAGEDLRAAGIDLNLFPVADVATIDSPLADRTFSDDPQVAAAMTAAAVRGCRQARIACAPLHFPGLGAASQDTDEGPATVSLDPASLAARDVEAFRAAFAERAPAVVLSLAYYAAYDPVTPGALTPGVTTELLRDELGFEGLAITDDLSAGAITATYPAAFAAVEALRAGADLIQISRPSDQRGVREALVEAVSSGQIPELRLDEAAGRVLELKLKLGLLRFR
jgi:beta-N-acetylhexosaminidase